MYDSVLNTYHFEYCLHPLLVYQQHIYNNNVYCKTIKHQKGLKRKTEKWTYPDLVGVQFVGLDWSPAVRDLAKNLGVYKPIRLLSYEVKQELNPLNYKEVIAQANSNSGWSNESYVAALEIEPDQEFRNELRVEAERGGIGVIELNEPDNSQLLCTARPKLDVQLATVQKLYNLNSDFKEFIDTVNGTIGFEIVPSKFDEILEPEDLKEYLKTVKFRKAN